MTARKGYRRLVCFGAAALAILLAGGATGCSDRNDQVDSLSATYGLPSTRVDLEAENWVLVPAENSNGITGDTPVTLAVDGEQVSGSGPCNAYHGDLDLEGDSVEITNLASTLRACGDPVMKAEGKYFAALEAVDQIDVSDDRLVLANDQGVRLVFRPADATGD
ncbi:MAG: META domain-containing protein [Acidimicrobiia bacterium]|nr:META domain-containing protein [Acidimicrobiia bacterium]